MTTINLTESDDTYTATAAGDYIFALGGNDTVTANDGGNTLYGGDGNDTLNGGKGDDTLYGDNATNALYHNILKGAGGNDHIVSFSWYDTINGGNGNDYVESFAMTTGQAVDGGSGIDQISIRSLSGQSENIHLVMGSTFSPTVGNTQGATYANFEALEFYGGTGSNTIEGGAYNDTIVNTFTDVSNFAAGSLKGMGGDDLLQFNGFPTAGTGTESIDGGSGSNDRLLWSNGTASFSALNINAANGTMKENGATFAHFTGIEALSIQTFFGASGTVTFNGTEGNDFVDIYASSSNLNTKGGNDTVYIDSGTATVDGGSGNDSVLIVFANANSCTIHGGDGNDGLGGGQGQNQVYGEDGNDNISAQNGRTSLYGGRGDDSLSSTTSYSMISAGNAVLDGGAGRDTLSLEHSLGGTTFTNDFSQASITLADGTQILNVEAITFVASSGNDVLTASNDAGGYLVNKLLGLGGDDTLTASSHGATLDGGGGANNMLIAGAGADKLTGGTASYANSTRGVTIDQTLLTGQVSAGYANGDILTATVAGVLGSSGADTIAGNQYANILNGAGGNDSLTGRGGHDTLTGGLGTDSFVYTTVTDSTGSGFDSVTDFDAKREHFQVGVAVTAMDNTVHSGALSVGTFDTDMDMAIAHKLKAGHAILFTPDAGDEAGKVFLVVDQNGQIGYQTGVDLVIEVTGIQHIGSLAATNFTT